MKYFAIFLILSTILPVILSFKINSKVLVLRPLFAKKENDIKPKEKKFSFANLIQLVALGAGAPMLGEYKETDAQGRMIFELEANNLTDKDGNSKQMQAKFFNDGYVENDFENEPPKFWANLLSGGKLQEEWDQKQESVRSKSIKKK